MKKNLPYGCEAIAKRKCGSGGVTSPIYNQASREGHLIVCHFLLLKVSKYLFSLLSSHYFKHIKISALALLKMVMHARSGGNLEVMGLLLGKVIVIIYSSFFCD